MPPIFSSSRISPVPAVIPKLVPMPELAEPARALVGVEHLDQEVLAALGARVDDLAGLEAEADARRPHGRRSRRAGGR